MILICCTSYKFTMNYEGFKYQKSTQTPMEPLDNEFSLYVWLRNHCISPIFFQAVRLNKYLDFHRDAFIQRKGLIIFSKNALLFFAILSVHRYF